VPNCYEVEEIIELKRQGLSVSAISELTGSDRKTIRKYLRRPATPVYGPRLPRPSKLDGFKPFLQERVQAGIWNAVVLLRELRERSYTGGYTILKDWLQPQRDSARTVAVRRFETPPGKQAQVDWGHLGSIEMHDEAQKLWGFTFTLGYSRMLMAEAAVDQKLGTLLRMHEEAFRQLGGVPAEILYDRMKTVWLDTDERGGSSGNGSANETRADHCPTFRRAIPPSRGSLARLQDSARVYARTGR
jgi:transposase